MTRVEIDPNVRVRGNQTYSGLEDATDPVAVGDKVIAAWSETPVVFDAEVTDVDDDQRLVYLAVAWGSGREEDA